MGNLGKKVLFVLAASFAMTQAVSAQEIVFTGEKCPLTVIHDLDAYKAEVMGEVAEAASSESTSAEPATSEGTSAEPASSESTPAETASSEGTSAETAAESTPVYEEKDVESLDLLCILDDAYVAAVLDGDYVYIPYDELLESVTEFDLSELPSVLDWTDIGNGEKSDLARDIQTELISLGFLQGSADGIFGSQSETAVSAFQTAQELPVTGKVNLFTFGLLNEKASGEQEEIETPYPPVYTVESKFASIYKNVADASVLEDYLEPEWKFNYDPFEGKGEIATKDAVFGTWTDDSGRAIDRLSLSVRQVIFLESNEDGRVRLIPALMISSVGAYRPYIKSGMLRIGDDVMELPAVSVNGWVEGADVHETTMLRLGDVELPEEDSDKAAEDSDEELLLRLNGAVRNYDITRGQS